MKNFEIRCDESRLEKNHTLYGKFSLGPFLPGQGTTFGNALRRSLLSELSGLGITAFEIIGVMQEFSTLPGLRESVLDLSLNLKQIVLTGVLPFSTPPIGFLKVRGPAIIYAADLKLPAGVYCAAPKQYIATLASNGVLNFKFLVSVGKGHSTQPYSLYRSLSKVKLQPCKTESTFFANSNSNSPSDVHLTPSVDAKKRMESIRELNPINKASQLHTPEVTENAQHFFNEEWKNQASLNSVAEIEKNKHIGGPTGDASKIQSKVENLSSDIQSSLESTNKKTISSVASPMHPTAIRELELKRQKNLNAEILNYTGETESANYEKKEIAIGSYAPSSTWACIKDAPSPSVTTLGVTPSSSCYTRVASEMQLEDGVTTRVYQRAEQEDGVTTRVYHHAEQEEGEKRDALETNGGIKYVNIQKQTFQRVNPHQVLPIDAVFTPVSQVNFLTQVNDRFETPRENVVLEIWTNGSIHPKRALEEAALSLVQNFDTLLKNIQQASSFDKGLRYSNSFQSFNDFSGKSENSQIENDYENVTKKKVPLITDLANKVNVPLQQAIYNLDIGNLDLSLETFILLKQAKIKNLAHLLKNLYSKKGRFFVQIKQDFSESAINNVDIDKKIKSENFSNVFLNEKIIEELSKIFSQLGIHLQ